jgi:uncharacterized protein YndB with AHSA1/START domain
MRIALIVIGLLVVTAASVVAIGAALPIKHVARVRAELACSADQAWHRLTAFSKYPDWRRGLRQVERTPSGAWKEIGDDGEAVTYETTEVVPLRRLVRRINDQDLPFGGRWIIELEPADGGRITMTITEEGEVYNPLFRFVSRFIMGHHAGLRAFLEDFGRSVGAKPEVTVVP